MKTLTVEIWKGEKFHIAQCVEHSNCFAQGKTIDEAVHNIKEVLCLILGIRHPKIHVILKNELVDIL